MGTFNNIVFFKYLFLKLGSFSGIDEFFKTPFLDTIIFIPVVIAITLIHYHIIKNITGSDNKFRFYFANLILTGGIYSIYMVVISFPLFSYYNFENSVLGIMVNTFLLLIISLTLPLWYKKTYILLRILYIIYIIYLLHPLWFFYSYFYLCYILYKFNKNKNKESIPSYGLSILGIIIYLFIELAFIPRLFF